MNNSIFESWKKELNLTFVIFKFGFKDVNESLRKIFSDFAITFARFGIAIWLYYCLFSYKGGNISGVNLQTVAWSMFFYFVFMYISPRYISTEIQKDVQSGKIETLLSKPANYILYKLGEYLGTRFITFLITSICGTILMALFLGIPPYLLNLNFLATFPVVIFLCFILTFEIFVTLGFMAFWVEDIISIRWLLDKAVMILGGAYFPIAFFPEILKKISLYTPIGASQFVTYAAYENWSQIYLKLFCLQIFWIIVLGLLLYFVQKKAFENLSVNGG
jgi:ABC-2 type transport system permease protein